MSHTTAFAVQLSSPFVFGQSFSLSSHAGIVSSLYYCTYVWHYFKEKESRVWLERGIRASSQARSLLTQSFQTCAVFSCRPDPNLPENRPTSPHPSAPRLPYTTTLTATDTRLPVVCNEPLLHYHYPFFAHLSVSYCVLACKCHRKAQGQISWQKLAPHCRQPCMSTYLTRITSQAVVYLRTRVRAQFL